ncbi:hypothetical protein [Rhodococcus sp. IEGM 1379]|uniref:hypothetical protein n=1 Tax=Rhodococcus sp. IEGM 1379 TaxID=3047086 RepID=UPI0024B67800|nr:hypothetical protein [Rhodococcus sp. IEGM 1379]MDI9914341.1 hypothetical protein [Rhodococcus sp. IEGM 1379]
MMEVVVAKADKDGIVRDRRTGIVLARRNRHPMADLFRDAPMGEGLPGMHMDPMAEHLLAIHIFDNLDCLPPQNPLYKQVPDPESLNATGTDRVIYVPIGTPGPADVEAEEPIIVADISDYTEDQDAALELQLRQKRIARKLLEQADPQVRGEGDY